jgi:hypothetical protein
MNRIKKKFLSKGGLPNSSSSSGSSSSHGDPRKEEGGAVEVSFGRIAAEVEKYFSRPFKKLPVHKDLHRLASRIHVLDEEGKQVNLAEFCEQGTINKSKQRQLSDSNNNNNNDYNNVACASASGSGSGSGLSCLYQLIAYLAHALDSEHEQSILHAFQECVDPSGTDTTGNMIEFFKRLGVGEDPIPHLRWCRVVKLVNQNIVAPAIIELQLCLPLAQQPSQFFPTDEWNIYIQLKQEEGIIVTHQKMERNQDSAFRWQLVMRLDSSAAVLEDVRFQITQLIFPNTQDGQQRRKAFVQFLGKYYANKIADEVVDIWSKRHYELPIHKDLPALVGGIEIWDGTDQPFAHEIGQSAEEQLKNTLRELARLFCPEKVKVIDDEFSATYNKQDVVGSLRSFLREKLLAPPTDAKDHECQLTRILKLLHNSIAAPAVIYLHETIGKEFPFQDEGGWKITILDKRTNQEQGGGVVVVRHSKWEKGKGFWFGWFLEICLEADLSEIIAVQLQIQDVRFGQECAEQDKRKISKLLLSCTNNNNSRL